MELFISARISDRRTRRNSPRQTELNREAQHRLVLYNSLNPDVLDLQRGVVSGGAESVEGRAPAYTAVFRIAQNWVAIRHVSNTSLNRQGEGLTWIAIP